MTTLSSDLKQNIWWVPDDSLVWTLATQEGPELPNGMMNFSLTNNIKGTQIVTHPVNLCLKIDNYNPNQESLLAPEDLIFLSDVNAGSILNATRIRFFKKSIYTSCGSVLISLNPFGKVPGLYGRESIEKYASNRNIGSRPSHLYNIPSRAFDNLVTRGNKNQTIFFSGESGAGKTEATKECLNFLTWASATRFQASSNSYKNTAETIDECINRMHGISERIIAASPIMEAFGNAQTIRNPNSSRFGKFMEIHFDNNLHICGSTIVPYLLEKSRLTHRNSDERTYHIFYQFLLGSHLPSASSTIANSISATSLGLVSDINQYRYLRSNEQNLFLPKFATQCNESFQETIKAFHNIGFSHQEVSDIFKLLAALLYLGNIEFLSLEEGESSMVSPSCTHYEKAAELLGISPSSLNYALCTRSIASGLRRNLVTIKLTVDKASDARDCFTRSIYDKLFKEIISSINRYNKVVSTTATNAGEEFGLDITGSPAGRSIGLLDIFGFEIFAENNFEQLCINYCNEILQNHFNYVIFTAEKQLYLLEGITCSTIEFKDNSSLIQEIQSIFKSFDEESRIPKGTSATWFAKKKREVKSNYLTFWAKKRDFFSVRHYAGVVDYIPDAMLEKNTETITNELTYSMQQSSSAMLRNMFASASDSFPLLRSSASSEESEGISNSPRNSPVRSSSINNINNNNNNSSSGGSLSAKSVVWQFQDQLSKLLELIRQSDSHFVRCIKSNDSCKPFLFDNHLVNKQLLYSGIFEVVKIQQSGLPCRVDHSYFMARYRCLVLSKQRWQMKLPNHVINALKKLSLPSQTSSKASGELLSLPFITSGKSMVFFKGFEQNALESLRDELLLRSTTILQTATRAFSRRNLYTQFKRHKESMESLMQELNTRQADIEFQILLELQTRFERISRFPILPHVIELLKLRLELVDKQSILLEQLEELRPLTGQQRTHEKYRELKNTLVIAKEKLLLGRHPVVLYFEALNERFIIAEEFVLRMINGHCNWKSFYVEEMQEGLLQCQEFDDVFAFSEVYKATIISARSYLELLALELDTIVNPLTNALQQEQLIYDKSSGSLVYSNGLRNPRSQLIEIIEAIFGGNDDLSHRDFQNDRTSELCNDCRVFVKLREIVLLESPPFEYILSVVSYLDSIHILSPVILKQMSLFQPWIDAHLFLLKVVQHLPLGRITRSSDPLEYNVHSTKSIEETELEQLSLLMSIMASELELNYSFKKATDLYQATSLIIKVRRSFFDAQLSWQQFESLVISSRNEAAILHVTDYFPPFENELDVCDWVLQLHDHKQRVGDLLVSHLFVILPLDVDGDDWASVRSSLNNQSTLFKAASDFVAPRITNGEKEKANPNALVKDLSIRLSVLQQVLDIRTSIITHQFNKTAALISQFQQSHLRDVAAAEMASLVAEFDLYSLLLYRIEAEDNLDAELEVFHIQGNGIDTNADISEDRVGILSLPYITISDDYDLFHTLTVVQDSLAEAVTTIRLAIQKFDSRFPPTISLRDNNITDHAIDVPQVLTSQILLTSDISYEQFNKLLNAKINFARHCYLAREMLYLIGCENDLGRSKYHYLLKFVIDQLQRFLKLMDSDCTYFALYNSSELNNLAKVLSFHYNVGSLITGINLRCLSSSGAIESNRFTELDEMVRSLDTRLYPLVSFICSDLVQGLQQILLKKYALLQTVISIEELSTIDSSHYMRKSFVSWASSDILQQISNLKEDPRLVMTLFQETFHNLEDELNALYIEYQIRNAVNELLAYLESIQLHSLSDAGFPELIDISTSSQLVDFESLLSACSKVANFIGTGRVFLPEILDSCKSFASILTDLFNSESSSSCLEDLSTIQTLASKFQNDLGLSSGIMNQIVVHMQNLAIVPMIRKALTNSHTSKGMNQLLNEVKGSLGIFPNQLQIWSTSAFHYCVLIETLETCDWRHAKKIIKSLAEACNDLELKVDEYQRSLSVAQALNIQAMKEFIASLKEDIIEADRSAYDLSKEEQQLFQKLSNGSSTSTKVTLESVQRQIIVREDKSSKKGLFYSRIPQGVQSDEAIVTSKSFPLRILWGFEFSPALLIQHGQYSVADLFEVGYTLEELFIVGVPVVELKAIGATAVALETIRVPIKLLREASYSEIEILEAGYPISELRDAHFNLNNLVSQRSVTVRRLLEIGFDVAELHTLGFSASSYFDQSISFDDMDMDAMKEMGEYIERILPAMIDAGFQWDELKEAGLSAVILHDFGCSFQQLRSLGYNDNDLIESGFVEEIEREILVDLFNATGGENWRIKMNWCSNKPVRDWYGIITCTFATEEDKDNNQDDEEETVTSISQRKPKTRFEHVVELALFDNDLVGSLPARLAGLTQLQALKLQLNPGLHGVIPPGILAMRSSLDIFDLSGNDDLVEISNHETDAIESSIKSYHPQFGQFSTIGDLFGSKANSDMYGEENTNTMAATNTSTRNYTSIVGNSSRLIAKTTSPYLERQRRATGNRKGALNTMATRLDALSYNAHIIIAKELHDHVDEQHRSRTIENHVQSLASAMLSSALVQGHNQPVHNHLDEYTTLVAIFEATNGHAWHSSANWCSDKPFHEWFGVSVNSNGRVIKIALAFNSMEGELPDVFHNFKYLEIFDCCSNVLSGRLPASLFYLERINVINLSSNQFTGSLPGNILQLRSIKRLDLKGNKLAGKIPKAIFQLSTLQYLDLSRNSLSCEYSVYQGKALLPFCRTVVF